MKLRQMTKVHRPENPPEKCCLCQSTVEKYFLDTGFDTEFEGTFYICARCIDRIVAHSPDHYTKENVSRLLHESRQEAAQAIKDRDEAMKLAGDYRERLRSIHEQTSINL